MRILIGESDADLALLLARSLESDGNRVRVVVDGQTAVREFGERRPDLTIIDLCLPMKSGDQALGEMRAIDADVPVMVLSAQQEVESRVRCLDLGADDVMVRPFSLYELRARCRALLRRKGVKRLQLRAGDLELDRVERTVHRGGRPVELTRKEFALLEFLMLNRGECFSRVELLQAVWKNEGEQTAIS